MLPAVGRPGGGPAMSTRASPCHSDVDLAGRWPYTDSGQTPPSRPRRALALDHSESAGRSHPPDLVRASGCDRPPEIGRLAAGTLHPRRRADGALPRPGRGLARLRRRAADVPRLRDRPVQGAAVIGGAGPARPPGEGARSRQHRGRRGEPGLDVRSCGRWVSTTPTRSTRWTPARRTVAPIRASR